MGPVLIAILSALFPAQDHPLVEPVEGSRLSSRSEEEGEMLVTFRDEDGRHRETLRGRHVSLEYELPAGVSRERIMEHFEKQVELLDATVHRRLENRLTFSFRREDGGETWCELWATDGSYALEILDEPSSDPTGNVASTGDEAERAREHVGDVEFAPGSSSLVPGTGALLDEVARGLEGAPGLRLELRGFRDPAEAAGLAETRARVVADALALYGIGDERLEVTARIGDGESSRRVEIFIVQ